ncbi:MAG: hypothetical protein AAF787_11360 [Chloroflexota bacterium]
MGNSTYSYQHYLLRSISTQFQLPDTPTIAQQPGIQSVFRVTCHYPGGDFPDSVATVVSSQVGQPTLTVHRNGSESNGENMLDRQAFEALTATLSTVKFDKLADQPDIPSTRANLWLIERAAGSFIKGVLLSPELATDDYQSLVFRLHELLPAAVEPLRQ